MLSRPERREYNCGVRQRLQRLGTASWVSGALVSTPSGAFLFDNLVISRLMADGTLSTGVALSSELEPYLSTQELVSGEDGLGALWRSAVAPSTFVFAGLDDTGVLITPSTPVAGLGANLLDARLAARPGGYALAYLEANSDYTQYSVNIALLDPAGVIEGEVKRLLTGTGSTAIGALLAVPGGYAVTYSTTQDASQTYLAFTDSKGDPDGEPLPLGRPWHFGMQTQSLLQRGDQLVIAFTQQDSGDYTDVAINVHLARFDLTTRTALVADVPLRTPVVDLEYTSPKLVPVGNDVGLIWSQGTVIYVCAGCMPDNHLEFIVLDGVDLVPVSQRVVLQNQEPWGGFIRPQIARFGDDVLVTSTLQYHTGGEGAFANILCVPAE